MPKFEDLAVWQKARELTRVVYEITRSDAFDRDRDLRTQMRKAAVSIMSNLAEGYERRGDREFGHFVSIAKGSSGEVRSQLYVAKDQNYLDEVAFNDSRERAAEVARMLHGLGQRLRGEGARNC